MPRIVFLLASLLAFGGLASAQSKAPSGTPIGNGCNTEPGPEWPNNAWNCDPEGFNWLPSDVFVNQFCVYVLDDAGNKVGVPGVVGQISTYTTQLTGDHSHEIVTSSGRPQAKITYTPDPVPGSLSDPSWAISDGTGCANWVTVLPGFSGFYTFQVSYLPFVFEIEPGVYIPVQFPPDGINNFAAFYGVNENDQFEELVPYPDNQSINAAQSLMVDQNHNQGSRFFQPQIVNELTAASTQYVTDSTAATGVRDRANIYRGSTQYGGTADNISQISPATGFVAGFANWQQLANEFHQQGVEADILNPSFNQSDSSVTSLLFGQLISDMTKNGCYLGTQLPGGGGLTLGDRRNYWLIQQYIHVSCAPLQQ